MYVCTLYRRTSSKVNCARLQTDKTVLEWLLHSSDCTFVSYTSYSYRDSLKHQPVDSWIMNCNGMEQWKGKEMLKRWRSDYWTVWCTEIYIYKPTIWLTKSIGRVRKEIRNLYPAKMKKKTHLQHKIQK